MKVRLALLTFLILCEINSYSQQLTFQKTYGGIKADDGKSVQQTSDGGYIFAGQIHTMSADSVNLYLIKTDLNGDTLWTSVIGDSLSDWANSVQQTSDGGYIVAGGTFSYGAFNEMIFLNKVNASGNIVWSKALGGSNINDAYCVRQTPDGGYIISGITLSYGAGNGDLYLIKTDANGDTVWTHTYGAAPGIEYGSSVTPTSDGGYISAGYTTSFGTATDVYVVKTNSNGVVQWTKSVGGTGYDRANSIIEVSGGYIIGGYTGSFGAGGHDALIVKIDLTGNVVWSKAYGTAGTERGYSVRQTGDGGFILAGNTSVNGGDVYLLKTDSNGIVDWSKTYGGANNDWAWEAVQCNDGGYVAIRGSANFGAGMGDIYVIKTDTSGNSGCNDANFSTLENTQAWSSNNTASTVSAGANVINLTPNIQHGGSISTLCTTMGLEDVVLPAQINIYPNPAADVVNLELPTVITGEATIEVHSISGQLVSTLITHVDDSNIVFNSTSLSPGIYVVNIIFENSRYTGKLIK